jgi:hypothetical protein
MSESSTSLYKSVVVGLNGFGNDVIPYSVGMFNDIFGTLSKPVVPIKLLQLVVFSTL